MMEITWKLAGLVAFIALGKDQYSINKKKKTTKIYAVLVLLLLSM